MLNINTNLSGRIAQNALKNSTLLLNQAVERMTTGYKINHAKDNAANYSIVNNLTTKINAYQVAEDNTAMGLDMVSTAGDTLSLISDKLARIRALAEKAANGTYGKQSLSAINREASAISDEIFRIINATEYNGKKLFGLNTGPDMNKLTINSDGFIQDVDRRNTDNMTALSEVNENNVLAKGTYCISSAQELAKLARMQNNGKITDGSEFVLAADIDLSAINNWTPIGWENGALQTNKAFSGTFDGNGYTISNLKCSQSSTSAAGLFGSVKNATFKNIGIENAKVSGLLTGSIVGCLKDSSNLTMENCYAIDTTISGTGFASTGGLIGGQEQAINTDSNTSANITSCYTKAVIQGAHWGASGGIIAKVSNCSVKNCFSDFEIICVSSNVGGIVGASCQSGEIDNCFAKGNINDTGSSGSIGGICGNGDLKIKNCYFEGNLNNGAPVGGILGGCYGHNPVYLENCSAKTNINGNKYSGGIAGWTDCEGGVIKNCNFNGQVNGTNNKGAIVGGGIEDKLEVKDCTYNKTLTGDLEIIGDGLGIVNNVIDCNQTTVLQVGINADENSQIGFGAYLELDELRNIILSGLQNNNVLEKTDGLLAQINAIQTQLGAVENRLESVLEEISTNYENLSSSKSTLKDADIAKVSSQYIQQQILQQASATLLATANQSPSIALQLI